MRFDFFCFCFWIKKIKLWLILLLFSALLQPPLWAPVVPQVLNKRDSHHQVWLEQASEGMWHLLWCANSGRGVVVLQPGYPPTHHHHRPHPSTLAMPGPTRHSIFGRTRRDIRTRTYKREVCRKKWTIAFILSKSMENVMCRGCFT